MTEKSIWSRLFGMGGDKAEEPAPKPQSAPAEVAPASPPVAEEAAAAPRAKWDKPVFDGKPPPRPRALASSAASAATTPAPRAMAAHKPEPAVLPDHVRARIRERYFRSRFPDVPLPAPGSKDASAIVKAARLYFEDGDTARAVELLRQASDMLTRVEGILLAKLEIHYLDHNEAAFTETARIFAERFPGSSEWPAVARLGWRLAPSEALFANARPAKVARDDQYGAWPEVPNWIEAPWDLTGEVLAVELRSRILAASHTAGKPA
jgi:hypothetical protein